VRNEVRDELRRLISNGFWVENAKGQQFLKKLNKEFGLFLVGGLRLTFPDMTVVCIVYIYIISLNENGNFGMKNEKFGT